MMATLVIAAPVRKRIACRVIAMPSIASNVSFEVSQQRLTCMWFSKRLVLEVQRNDEHVVQAPRCIQQRLDRL